MKIFIKKDNIHIFLILLWIIFWIYLYNNPIHFLWQPIVLFSIPIYLFLHLIYCIFKKRHNKKATIIIIIYSIILIVFNSFVDYDTFRAAPTKKIIIDRIDGGQWRVLVFRKNGQFEEFVEDWLEIKIFGINFRESFGIGNYDVFYDNTLNIYYKKFITNHSFQPLDYETLNKGLKSNVKYVED